ncbi:hypothetical protein BBK36DRAFT_1207567 [Trichoderma citrinoviride]|uniref:Secreted protein n=1 Tax=Trichoderma citrinoviride TaxID=58853 RepID=A0A2T4BCQ4_9HYPO|nr:hypothetical protein BBK36DRAFT_1207567 [Trichoderma citrinoviride]PTB67113.1 hypothetical protein BBK36DRAFT_1207567 [Trichoderma citrinoviride]
MKRGPRYLVLAVLVDRSLSASALPVTRAQPHQTPTPDAGCWLRLFLQPLAWAIYAKRPSASTPARPSWLCPSKNAPSLVGRPLGDHCRRFEAQRSLRCLQLCLRVQVAQVQRQSHASIARDSGSTPAATATLSPASQDEVGVYSTQSSRDTAHWRCSPPQASPRPRQKIIGKQRCQPQPSDQRLSTDDWLLCMAPNRKMTSWHRMTPS